MATKRNYFTLNELNKRFKQINPQGQIWAAEKANQYKANYQEQGKVYTYKAKTLWDLAEKLNLVTKEDINKMKGIKILPCGCPTDENNNYFKCNNCGRAWREPTQAELQAEQELNELWT